MVRTDGVSCCVVQVKRGVVQATKGSPRRAGPAEKYVDELTAQAKEDLSRKVVVGVDPGMGNLLYFSSDNGTERKQMRYTQKQRCMETRAKKYSEILKREKGRTVVDGRTIAQWEAELSEHSHKTVSLAAFKEYIGAKLRMNSKISEFYEARWHRKQRLNGYFNRCRSEARLLGRLKEMFGEPKDVVIGIGDWEQRRHRKFKEPVKGKGFRETLRRGGYRVLLVDEHRTSVQCSHCQQDDAKCHKFLPSTRRDRNGRCWLVHGLLLCQQCRRPWNRDANASLNIERLAKTALAGLPRPEYLQRSREARKRKGDSEPADDGARKKPAVGAQPRDRLV
jgi:hypothetical protein